MNLQQFGRYKIIEEIGRGGMATVFRASDPNFGREVALKVLSRQQIGESKIHARFEQEAKLIAVLEHSAIVPVYDYGEHEGWLYLVMRYMRGGSLADKIAQGPLPLDETVRILKNLAAGLDLAHQKNIIHRDLKPGNVLFDENGNAYLSDFGIAKLSTGIDSTLTIQGKVVGTPCYMSPEQAKAEKGIDGRSDIYSLGVIFYEMVTGAVPYEAKTPVELAQMHISEPIPNILAANPQLPARCQNILNKAMAKNPADRYKTATKMAEEVSRLVQPGLGAIVESLRPHPSRRIWAAVTLFLIMFLFIAAGFFVLSIVLSSLNPNDSLVESLTKTAIAAQPPLTITPSFPDENDNGNEEPTGGTSNRPKPPIEIHSTPIPEPTTIPLPVFFNGGLAGDVTTLDPQKANNPQAFDFVENLFINLTNYNPADNTILPEAAVRWEVSEDSQTYTFYLRDDIPWVSYDPETGETVPVVSESGNPRYLTAQDFVFSIRRLCDPRTGSAYIGILVPIIGGCQEVYNTNPAEITETLLETVLATAPDSETLVIELAAPSGYFLTFTAMTTMAASPSWIIESQPENWFEPGTIVTNGRYLLSEWVRGERIALSRNHWLPTDLQGSGNIDQLNFLVYENRAAVYNSWKNNEIDLAIVPDEMIETDRNQYGNQTIEISDNITFFIAFRTTKPPFNNVNVRRAFSAAYNRVAFINQSNLIFGWPARHFAPPEVFGSPPIGEIGIVFNPDYAREELAAAGYPNCEGFPEVTIMGNEADGSLQWLEFSRSQWVENLGCPADLFNLEQLPFEELFARISRTNPDESAPHMWTYGWGKRYPDENDWVGEVVWCESGYNFSNRACSATDDLIVEARQTTDQAARIELYELIELRLFGRNGEVPFFPIYHKTQTLAFHAWLTFDPVYYGGQHWYDWQIDAAEKANNQNES